jgi:hypothetical protein
LWCVIELMNRVLTYILLFSLLIFFSDRWAVSSMPTQNSSSKQSLQFNPPNNGAPGGNRSQTSANTGSRDDCPTVETAITALVPKNNWGTTLTERPTLWFYIPYQQGTLTLILKDEATAAIFARSDYPIEKGGGIMSFPLPETVPPLEIDRAYRWQVYFSCDPEIEPQFTKVQGVVERVATDSQLARSLASTITVTEKVNLYAKQGLWHETIAEIIATRQEDPEDRGIDELWLNLLADPNVALEDFISEPLVECCNSLTQ